MKRGLAQWATALFGFILILLGILIVVFAGNTHPLVFWAGVVIMLIGGGMIFVVAVLP